jgi:hypothetical protein
MIVNEAHCPIHNNRFLLYASLNRMFDRANFEAHFMMDVSRQLRVQIRYQLPEYYGSD